MSIRTQRRSRIGAAAVVAALIASLFAFISPAGALTGAASEITRYAGANRYETAAQAAIDNFGTNEANIVLASGENFPDGLAAAYLAGALDAPLLLTAQSSLPAATANALGVLAADNATVHVIGGTAAVSQNVRNQLTGLGYTVEEISGANRYATAAAVADAGNDIAGVGTFQGGKTAILVTGENFPDALSAGPFAYAEHLPILLTTGSSLSSEADAALTSLGIQRVVILGGTAAVSQAVEDAVAAKGITVQRVSGANRNHTAAALAGVLLATQVNGGPNTPWAVQGDHAPGVQFVLANGATAPAPDALAASQVGGRQFAPLLLVSDSLPIETAATLQLAGVAANHLFVMGGTAAVSAEVLAAAIDAGTPDAVTATITAEEGRDRFTVTFASAVNVGSATTIANYAVNNAPGDDLTSKLSGGTVVYDPTTLTATVTLGAGSLAVNDVVTVSPTVAKSVLTNAGGRVPRTDLTVQKDTSRPSATIQAFAEAAPARSNVWVIFSEPVTGGTPQVSIDGGPGSNLTVVANTGNVVWELDTPLTAGQTVTLAENQVTDLAGNFNTQATSNVKTDTAAPSIVSANYTVTAATQATARLTGAGTVDIAAKAGGIADGALGNLWSVVRGTQATNPANPTVTVTVNTELRQIGVNGHVAGAVDANKLAQALAANPTFNENFTVTVVAGGDVTIAAAGEDFGGGAPEVTGTSTVKVTLTFNESINPASAFGAITFVSSAGTITPGAPTTGLAAITARTVTFTYATPTDGPVPQHVNVVAGDFFDLKGNPNAPQSNVPVTPAG